MWSTAVCPNEVSWACLPFSSLGLPRTASSVHQSLGLLGFMAAHRVRPQGQVTPPVYMPVMKSPLPRVSQRWGARREYARECRLLKRPGEGIGSPEIRAIGNCESFHAAAGNQTPVVGKGRLCSQPRKHISSPNNPPLVTSIGGVEGL